MLEMPKIYFVRKVDKNIIIRQLEFIRALLSVRGSNILLEKFSYMTLYAQIGSLNSVNLPHIYQTSLGVCGIYDGKGDSS